MRVSASIAEAACPRRQWECPECAGATYLLTHSPATSSSVTSARMKEQSGEAIPLVIFLINMEQDSHAAGAHIPDD